MPTRVHERYLFPFFTAGALLAAEFLVTSAGFVTVSVLNAVNLHAVLAAPLSIFNPAGGFGRSAGLGVGRGGGGFGGIGTQILAIPLPFADLARSETVIVLVALGQTAAFFALLVVYIAVVLHPRRRFAVTRAEPAPSFA